MSTNLPARRPFLVSLDDGGASLFTDRSLFDEVLIRRAIAYLVDVVILAILALALWFSLGILALLSFGLLFPLQAAALTLLPIGYHTLFIGAQGATPGMRLLDVEARSLDGGPPDYLQAFVMSAAFYISVSVTAWLVLAVVLFNARRRTLHDFVSGIVVVRRLSVAAAGRLRS